MVVRGPDGGVQVISRAWSTGRVNLKAKRNGRTGLHQMPAAGRIMR